MLVKARLTERMGCRRSVKRATTCRKCRMRISVQDRGERKGCSSIRARFAKIPTTTDERFSGTTEASDGEFAEQQRPDGKRSRMRERKAGMLAGQNFLHRSFARVSPVFVVAVLLVIIPSCQAGAQRCCAPTVLAQPIVVTHSSAASEDGDKRSKNAERRDAAAAQFSRAEELRAELNSKAPDERKLAEYKQVVSSYRRVYLITPHAVEVPDALLAVAELNTEMGDRFGRSYYQSAVDTYQFLMREYPTSKYCQDAYLRSAKLQKDQLNDLAGASKTYETFLKKFPRSPHKREAQEARAELALLQNSASPSSPSKSAIAKSAESANESRE